MDEATSAIWIEITATRGSTPRDTGTVMTVSRDDTEGTIGGGALEYAAIATARKMLTAGQAQHAETIPLGPTLGQCCGGAVTLAYSSAPQGRAFAAPMTAHLITPNLPHPIHLWLWGAGHVGRAVVEAAHPQAFKVTWIDSSEDRFPSRIPAHVSHIPAADMPLLASRAPAQAHHLIFTYSHEIDLALCAALLRRGAASIGLIGSGTKRARFFKRLRGMGLDPSSIICPIGDKTLGKRPDQIAHGTLRALLYGSETKVVQ